MPDGIDILDKTLRGLPRLCLRNRILLRVGRWNGNQYLEEELKPIVMNLQRIEKIGPSTPEERNALCLFEGASQDHEDSSGTWVGKLSGVYYDEKDKAIKAEKMNIVDKAMAEKLLFQLRDGYSSFAISPRLDVRREKDICRDIIAKTWAIVINPAGGESLFLDKDKPGKDGKSSIRNLSFNITEGDYEENLTLSKGAEDMDLEKRMEALETMLQKLIDEKKDGAVAPTPAQDPTALTAVIEGLATLNEKMDKKAEAEAAEKLAAEKAAQEKRDAEYALMTAHLSDADHNDTACPLCIKDAELKKSEEEMAAKKKAEEDEKMAKEAADAEAAKKLAYPVQPNTDVDGIVPFLPRAFKIESLDEKSMARFAEDLSETVRPIIEKESMTAEELAVIVSALDNLLLTIPHDGPDPEVVAERAKKAELEKAELQKIVDEKVKEGVEKEVVKLTKAPGRKGKVIEIADPEPKEDEKEFVSPDERLGKVLEGFSKAITGQGK
jgi:hypothetical protein